MDDDLRSIQGVRDLIRNSKEALQALSAWSQQDIDRLVRTVVETCQPKAEYLAKLAVDETGFGKWEDKVLKNTLAGPILYESIKDLKTVGVVREDRDGHYYEVAVPVGVIAALVPSTNPTSTVIYKSLIALKGANTIIFSPHPNARKSIRTAVELVREGLKAAGAPENAVQVIGEPLTMEATSELMKHPDVGLILATGGPAMVKAAYSSGNPAIGVGAGNGPSYIEKSADVREAVRHIIESKTFDNGTICASEQSIVTESVLESEVIRELEAQGGYMLPEDDIGKLGRFILRANGTMNPVIVGKSAEKIAELAGINVPAGTKVLVARQTEVSKKNGYSREKLCPILAFYVERNWEACCERCIELLRNEGSGHTMTIHSNDERIIREFALKKPVSRLLVNTGGSLGGTGATTGLAPALTLGCGAVGKSSTSDNITPLNLINLRRVAYGIKELADLKGGDRTAAVRPVREPPYPEINNRPARPAPAPSGGEQLTRAQVEAVVRTVLAKLNS